MAKRPLTIILLLFIFCVLLVYLVVEQVSMDQVAAHYRLGRIHRIIRPSLEANPGGPSEVMIAGKPVTVEHNAGLFFKLPFPIDKIVTYDQRIQHVDGPVVQMQLSDENQVIPRAFATWRVIDPVAYQQTLGGDEDKAREKLNNLLGDRTQAVFGQYVLDDIVNTDPDKLKLDEIEGRISRDLRSSVEGAGTGYGIDVCSVGISWVALPPEATAAVFDRMRQERTTEATRLLEEGEKIKRTMVAEANKVSDVLLADAEAEARAIRARGEEQAAKSYATFAENAELAIFLRKLESIRKLAQKAAEQGNPLTIILSTDTAPFDVLRGESLFGGKGPEAAEPGSGNPAAEGGD